MNFIETVAKVNSLLIEKDEWINRYKKYAKNITTNQQLHKDGRTKFKIPKPFHLYTNISNLYSKNSTYDIRFLGQSVATLKINQGIVTISTNKKNKKYFGINIPLLEELWDSTQSSTFRKSFKQCKTIKGRSPEHTVESALLSEFKQKNKNQKSLYNIQPVLLAKSFFQMATPLKASSTIIEYARKGGGIDILARVKHKDNSVKLCVMELKDENTKSEPAKKVMNQAIAYATFIAHLLRSESGNTWYNIFGFSGNVPEILTIDVSIVMPSPSNNILEDFNKERIKVLDDTFIELYALYFNEKAKNIDKHNYHFEGSLKEEMMK